MCVCVYIYIYMWGGVVFRCSPGRAGQQTHASTRSLHRYTCACLASNARRLEAPIRSAAYAGHAGGAGVAARARARGAAGALSCGGCSIGVLRCFVRSGVCVRVRVRACVRMYGVCACVWMCVCACVCVCVVYVCVCLCVCVCVAPAKEGVRELQSFSDLRPHAWTDPNHPNNPTPHEAGTKH
jgi:hypothetical protein